MVRSLQRGRLPQVHSTRADGRVVCRSSGDVRWAGCGTAPPCPTAQTVRRVSTRPAPGRPRPRRRRSGARAPTTAASASACAFRRAGAGLALAKMGAVACPWRVGPGEERMRMKGGALLGLVLLGSVAGDAWAARKGGDACADLVGFKDARLRLEVTGAQRV